MSPPFQRLRHVLRHPELILVVYVFRSVAALGLTWNWAKILGNASVMAYPRKDLELFAPGAAILLRTIAEQELRISRLAVLDLLLVIGIAIVGCAVTVFAFDTLLERRNSRESTQIRNSLVMAPKMLGISIVYWLSLIGVFLFAKLLYLLVPIIIYPVVGERGSDIAILLLALLVIAAVFIAFVASDLARAIAVQSNCGPLSALANSIGCLRQQLAECLVGAACWTIPAIAGPAIVEYFLASACLRASSTMMTLWPIHQLVVLVLCVLHLCWWSKAIDLVRPRRGNH